MLHSSRISDLLKLSTPAIGGNSIRGGNVRITLGCTGVIGKNAFEKFHCGTKICFSHSHGGLARFNTRRVKDCDVGHRKLPCSRCCVLRYVNMFTSRTRVGTSPGRFGSGARPNSLGCGSVDKPSKGPSKIVSGCSHHAFSKHFPNFRCNVGTDTA